jgi:transcriptional regulator with XRE-family HTH domain
VFEVEFSEPDVKADWEPTSGGAKLRTLRRGTKRTQLWVEAEAGLGTGYLQRVESGRVRQPGRETLERILDALDARYSERREILEVFGYQVVTPLPTPDDIEWAIGTSSGELNDFPFPAYLLDCNHRLLAWNAAFPRLLALHPADPRLEELRNRSILAAFFDPTSRLYPLLAEPDRFLPALLKAFRHEKHRFGREPWYADILDQLNQLPRFRHYWSIAETEELPSSAARALVPVRLSVPRTGELAFRLSTERLTRDDRFRLVFYFPTDPKTMDTCARWTALRNAETGTKQFT